MEGPRPVLSATSKRTLSVGSNSVATSPTWLRSTGPVDDAIEELNFKLHLTVINFNSYKRLGATVLSTSRQMSEYAS